MNSGKIRQSLRDYQTSTIAVHWVQWDLVRSMHEHVKGKELSLERSLSVLQFFSLSAVRYIRMF